MGTCICGHKIFWYNSQLEILRDSMYFASYESVKKLASFCHIYIEIHYFIMTTIFLVLKLLVHHITFLLLLHMLLLLPVSVGVFVGLTRAHDRAIIESTSDIGLSSR